MKVEAINSYEKKKGEHSFLRYDWPAIRAARLRFLLSYLNSPYEEVRCYALRRLAYFPVALCCSLFSDPPEDVELVLNTLKSKLLLSSLLTLSEKIDVLETVLKHVTQTALRLSTASGFLKDALDLLWSYRSEPGGYNRLWLFTKHCLEELCPWHSIEHLRLMDHLLELCPSLFETSVRRTIGNLTRYINRDELNSDSVRTPTERRTPQSPFHSLIQAFYNQSGALLPLSILIRIFRKNPLELDFKTFESIEDIRKHLLGSNLRHILTVLLAPQKKLDSLPHFASITILHLILLATRRSSNALKRISEIHFSGSIKKGGSLLQEVRAALRLWLPSPALFFVHRKRLLTYLTSPLPNLREKERTLLHYYCLLKACMKCSRLHGSDLCKPMHDLEILSQSTNVPTDAIRVAINFVIRSSAFPSFLTILFSRRFLKQTSRLPFHVLFPLFRSSMSLLWFSAIQAIPNPRSEAGLFHDYPCAVPKKSHSKSKGNAPCHILSETTGLVNALRNPVTHAFLLPLLDETIKGNFIGIPPRESFSKQKELAPSRPEYVFRHGLLYAAGLRARKKKRDYATYPDFLLFLRAIKQSKKKVAKHIQKLQKKKVSLTKHLEPQSGSTEKKLAVEIRSSTDSNCSSPENRFKRKETSLEAEDKKNGSPLIWKKLYDLLQQPNFDVTPLLQKNFFSSRLFQSLEHAKQNPSTGYNLCQKLLQAQSDVLLTDPVALLMLSQLTPVTQDKKIESSTRGSILSVSFEFFIFLTGLVCTYISDHTQPEVTKRVKKAREHIEGRELYWTNQKIEAPESTSVNVMHIPLRYVHSLDEVVREALARRVSFIRLVEGLLRGLKEPQLPSTYDGIDEEILNQSKRSGCSVEEQCKKILLHWLCHIYTYSTTFLDLLTSQALLVHVTEPLKPHRLSYTKKNQEFTSRHKSSTPLFTAFQSFLHLATILHDVSSLSVIDGILAVWGERIVKNSIEHYDLYCSLSFHPEKTLRNMVRGNTLQSKTSPDVPPPPPLLDMRVVYPALFLLLRKSWRTLRGDTQPFFHAAPHWVGLLLLGIQSTRRSVRYLSYGALYYMRKLYTEKWALYIFFQIARAVKRPCNRFNPLSSVFLAYSFTMLSAPFGRPAASLCRILLDTSLFHANTFCSCVQLESEVPLELRYLLIQSLRTALRLFTQKDVEHFFVPLRTVLTSVTSVIAYGVSDPETCNDLDKMVYFLRTWSVLFAFVIKPSLRNKLLSTTIPYQLLKWIHESLICIAENDGKKGREFPQTPSSLRSRADFQIYTLKQKFLALHLTCSLITLYGLRPIQARTKNESSENSPDKTNSPLNSLDDPTDSLFPVIGQKLSNMISTQPLSLPLPKIFFSLSLLLRLVVQKYVPSSLFPQETRKEEESSLSRAQNIPFFPWLPPHASFLRRDIQFILRSL